MNPERRGPDTMHAWRALMIAPEFVAKTVARTGFGGGGRDGERRESEENDADQHARWTALFGFG